MHLLLRFSLLLCVLLAARFSHAETITLKIPVIREIPTAHLYYQELLTKSLMEMGHQAHVETIAVPHLRAKEYLKQGRISLIWMLASKQRDEGALLRPVEVDLTGGLAGTRIFLIPQATQYRFDSIRSLSDFRASGLSGVFGRDWFDADVWAYNELPFVVQDGNWEVIYEKIGNSRIDYFSRSVLEIVNEAQVRPYLAIEKNLIFQYERDFRFYLSNEAGRLYGIIDKALRRAQATGLMDGLIRKYWARDLDTIDYRNRRFIKLETPK